MTHEMKEDIEKMCNISRSIKTEGIELGYELGIKQGRNESMLLAVKNLMQSLKLSSEEAMDALCIPQADRIHYLKSI